MAFGILLNQTDITDLMGQAQASVDVIPAADRALFNAAWNGGLKNWAVAPDAPAQYQEGDTPVKVLVVDAKQPGQQVVTKERFAQLLERMAAANPNAGFLYSVASDLRVTAVEPWV